jgi:phosphoribosylformimino-5-aminoimidazole carboxamide ribotide isomerase
LIIIPAIDLKGGKCVRLLQGDFERVTVYSDHPAEMAHLWREKGAERLHLVDLDGSVAGAPQNAEVIGQIVKEVNLPVEIGGGIRDLTTVKRYLDMGVQWVILGTAALKDRSFVYKACDLYPGRIILGIDATDGRVAVEGWTEQSAMTALELAKSYENCGMAAVIYTDIRRDGMQTGVNVEETRNLAEAIEIPVIASGGVATLEDIKRLLPLEKAGIAGVIVGKALYSGAIALEEAIHLAKQR